MGVLRYARRSGAAGHKDLSERLALCDRALYTQVKAILDENRSQRHIRGGMATRRKYKGI